MAWSVPARRKIAAFLSVTTLASLMALAVPATSARAATWFQPNYVRSIGGQGVAGVYAWGIQYNPVSNEILVGDYLNYRLRRYNLSGQPLGDFWRPNDNGQPYSIAVDPRNGDYYVPEIRDGNTQDVIAKYDKNGNLKFAFTVTIKHYDAWITVDNSGYLYILDSHYTSSGSSPNVVRKLSVSDTTKSATQVSSFSSYGNAAGKMGRCYGIDVDSSGNIWVTDALNSVLHKYSSTGKWLGDYGQGLFSGDLREVVVDDAHSVVYVVDAAASKIFKFSTSGTLLTSWGSEGQDPGQFGGGGRQATVDSSGNLWVADYANFRFEEFDPNGNVLGVYPDPPRGAGQGFLSQPRDVDTDPVTGDVVVADSWNQRVQRFDSEGTPTQMYGHRSSTPPYGFNYPRGIGIDPATRNVWVLNERGHYIRVFDPDGHVVMQLGNEAVDSTANGYFRWPEDVKFWNGRAIVSDNVGGVIKILDAATGDEIRTITAANHGTAVDPANGNMYVTDPAADTITEYDQNGNRIRRFGSKGNGNGQFQYAWDAVVTGGELYVTDTQISRVQVFDLNGNFLGKWGSFNNGPYDFKNPSGISADAQGHIFIADALNSRIQEYDTTTPKGTYAYPKPTGAITTPAPGSSVPGDRLVQFSGTATDDSGVATVEVSVQDKSTGLWWNGDSSYWTTTQYFNVAAWTGAVPSKNVNWSWLFNGMDYGRSYHAEVRYTDVFNIKSAANSMTDFTVLPKANDTADPETTIDVPQPNATMLSNLPIRFSGSATDDVAVAGVGIAIHNGATDQWWQPGGGWGDFTYLNATVATPGATSTPWSFTWNAPAAGSYGVTVQAYDYYGHVDEARPFNSFNVVTDTAAPTGTITTPTNNQTFNPGDTVSMTGTASDDIGVASASVSIQDTVSKLWWNGGAWGSAVTWLPATVASPGSPSTTWSFAWLPPALGSYGFNVRAQDLVGNLQSVKPWVKFSVINAPTDTTPPDGTMTTPKNNATFALGTSVDMAGMATDDTGVTVAGIAIQDTVSKLWWNGSGWGTAVVWIPSTLASPGATSTAWSFSWMPPTTGTYGLSVRAQDAAGNIDAARPWVKITVS